MSQSYNHNYSGNSMTEFVNPYNFIPFEVNGPERGDLIETYKDAENLRTGWLDVCLTARTKLIVPGKELSDDNGHKTYDFYRLPDGTPTIPGSSLRGMIRSMYEAASNSCLPFVLSDKETISLRTPNTVAFKARGLLRHDCAEDAWYLHEAEKYDIDDPITHDRKMYALGSGVYKTTMDGEAVQFQCGQLVRYNVNENGKAVLTESGEREGWIQFNLPPVISKKFTKKGNLPAYHVCVLTPIESKRTKLPVVEGWDGFRVQTYTAYDQLYDALNPTADADKAKSAVSAHISLLYALKAAKTDSSRYVPVWYLDVSGKSEGENAPSQTHIYLSPAAIGRVRQWRRWEEIAGKYAPCEDKQHTCPACQLFGIVSRKGLKLGGKLRFTDALPTEKFEPSLVHPRILSSPKPSAYEFYLGRPSLNGVMAKYWNYDYYSVATDDGYEYHYLEGAMPRGRKQYWHGDRLYVLNDPESPEYGNSKQNSSFYAADANTQFTFRVYFDGITEAQLDALRWVLTLGDNDPNSDLMYKLGHAKPFGFGSVKLTLTDMYARSAKWTGDGLDYSSKRMEAYVATYSPECPKDWDPEGVRIRSLLAMVNGANTRGKIVAYPISPKGTIFDWFSKNRVNSGPRQVLPLPTAKTITLRTEAREEQFFQDTQVPPNQRIRASAANAPTGGAPHSAPQNRDANALRPGVQARAKIKSINSTHGHSAYCRMGDGSQGFLKSKNDLSTRYKWGDIVDVMVGEFDSTHNTWTLRLIGE